MSKAKGRWPKTILADDNEGQRGWMRWVIKIKRLKPKVDKCNYRVVCRDEGGDTIEKGDLREWDIVRYSTVKSKTLLRHIYTGWQHDSEVVCLSPSERRRRDILYKLVDAFIEKTYQELSQTSEPHQQRGTDIKCIKKVTPKI